VPKPDAQGYYPTVDAVTVREGKPVAVKVTGEQILLIRLDEMILAVGRYCPHAAGDFANGEQVRHKLICPEHDYRFDLRNGRVLWPADETYCLKRFETAVKDGIVMVRPKAP
jgi:nitrite reductase/ring-hydroxylating ferredoxin subunit